MEMLYNANAFQNIYAELTFVCPSYWMAEAYSGDDRTSYKYQFSPLPALHGQDVASYFGPLGSVPYLSTEFQRAMMSKSFLLPPMSNQGLCTNWQFQKSGAISSQHLIHPFPTPSRLGHRTRLLQRIRHQIGPYFRIRHRIS